MMNQNHITGLRIENFKSIKELELDCKRINLLIGKPNVGKSNILSAIDLHKLPFYNFMGYKIEDVQMVKNLKDMFYFGEFENDIIKIEITNYHTQHININEIYGKDYVFKYVAKSPEITSMDIQQLEYSFFIKKEMLDNRKINGFVDSTLNLKRYMFKDVTVEKNPHDIDVHEAILESKNLAIIVRNLLKEFGFDLVYEKYEEIVKFQKKDEIFVSSLPFSALSDTLRRYIFHLAAIETNRDSVLLFEEPEAHCYPEYVKMLAWDIINSKSNQFFITTHSETVISTIIENLPFDEYTINIVYYEDYQTKVKQLTKEEIQEAIDYNYDILFNIDDLLKSKADA